MMSTKVQAFLLRKSREDKRLSREALARKADVSASLVEKLERGERTITYPISRKLGKALRVSWQKLCQQ